MRVFATTIFAILAQNVASARAQEPSIDSLLKKLPPPETLVKSPVQGALQENDPAFKDSLVQKIADAERNRDLWRMVDLAEQLKRKYPDSAGSHCLYGAGLLGAKKLPAAAAEFDQAIKLRKNFALAYFLLGLTEWRQQNVAAALPNFQKAAALEPKNPQPLIFVSASEGKLGHRQAAVEAAKHATTVSPAFASAWLRLALAEKGMGHTVESFHAITHAADLLPDNAYLLEAVGYSYINLNRIAEAIPPLERASHFTPNDDFLLQAQLGFCLEETGQVQAAIDPFASRHRGRATLCARLGTPRPCETKTGPTWRSDSGFRASHDISSRL